MTIDVTDGTNDAIATDEDQDRYGELTLGDDEFVIYDRENHQAWIQSTVAVSVENHC